MRSYVINVCLILYFNFSVLFINKATGISLLGLKDESNKFGNNDRLLVIDKYMKRPGIRSEGIFERFLRNLLETLIDHFPIGKLARYIRVLTEKLGRMRNKYSQRLSKHLRHLSKMYRDEIRSELLEYKNDLFRKSPHRVEFLNAMNDVFTLEQNLRFDDYIYDLRNYGTRDKLFIDEETSNLLNVIIAGTILKLSVKQQREIIRKLRRAVKEYEQDPDFTLPDSDGEMD